MSYLEIFDGDRLTNKQPHTIQVMKIRASTHYGIHSMIYLSDHAERLCNIREIANYYGFSYHHLVKVVGTLSRLGYIGSVRGKKGGIFLVAQPDHIRLGTLFCTLETKNTHPPSPIMPYLMVAQKSFISALNQYTLSDIRSHANRSI